MTYINSVTIYHIKDVITDNIYYIYMGRNER